MADSWLVAATTVVLAACGIRGFVAGYYARELRRFEGWRGDGVHR